MFGFPSSISGFLCDSLTSPDFMSPLNFTSCPLTQLTVTESFGSLSQAFHSCSSSSESYNSPCSMVSCCTQKQSFIQRRDSSHSLPNNGLHCRFTSSLNDFLESDFGPERRAFSTGDSDDQQWQHSRRRSESPLSNESNAIIEGMSRARRYSPEEKKERIQRYRTKRTLRNFNKKIKYTCRKTLADRRPRIRGRFARNEEMEKNVHQVERINIGGEKEEEENWVNFLDSLSAYLMSNP
ncbi:hypothetical protein DITRI_Ditri05aG0024300 [Diplodiscus trichospermus]